MKIDARKLMQLMTEKDKTVEELAIRAKVTPPTIYRIKRGEGCHLKTAKRIAAALKCDVKELQLDSEKELATAKEVAA